MAYSFCSEDFKAEPFWWGQTPPPVIEQVDLPSSVDVLIVGSGYTGLHCAIQTVSGGRQTLVIDAEAVGWGCSTRNGGQISGEIKPGYGQLRRKYGQSRALGLIREARTALAWVGDFVEREAIECDYQRCGRFNAAHNRRQFKDLVNYAQNQPSGLEQSLQIVSAEEQSREIDSCYYHGGIVIESHCSLDPAKYHRGLLELAQSKGAQVIDRCRATGIEAVDGGFRVRTSRGVIQSRELVIATNGYIGPESPWQQRRIIPIGSYMLATENMAPSLADRLIPQSRVFSDTRRIVVYFRKSPDGRRLLFGGRVSVFESDPVKSLPALRQEMLRIFPQLEDVKISHTWMGFVGYTFDQLPHSGVQDGIYYAMGYCGSGICLASYLGNRLGSQILGAAEGRTSFSDTRFQTRPLYRGKPWFLAAAVRYQQMLDRIS